ncbi:MAG: hypothetical protein JWQ64_3843 [Subtercola sp.]|nr:hypothetical protein [Subtercola sp.]
MPCQSKPHLLTSFPLAVRSETDPMAVVAVQTVSKTMPEA